jgi:hypothetical protein
MMKRIEAAVKDARMLYGKNRVCVPDHEKGKLISSQAVGMLDKCLRRQRYDAETIPGAIRGIPQL